MMVKSSEKIGKLLLAIYAKTHNVHRIPLRKKASAQLPRFGCESQFRGIDVSYGLARGTHKVMMRLGIRLHSYRSVVQADFAEDAALNKQMDIFVDSSQ